MEQAIACSAFEFKPSLWMRALRRMGFRYSAHAGRPEDEGAKYVIHRIVTKWGWRERVLLLVGGITETELCVEVDEEGEVREAVSQAVVLMPTRGQR